MTNIYPGTDRCFFSFFSSTQFPNYMVPLLWPTKARHADAKPDAGGDAKAAPSDALRRRNALKAKLRRQCEEKKGGKLLVPKWLHDMWRTGNKDELASTFEKCNFNTDTDLISSKSFMSSTSTLCEILIAARIPITEGSRWSNSSSRTCRSQHSTSQSSARPRISSSMFTSRSTRRRRPRKAQLLRAGIPEKRWQRFCTGMRFLAILDFTSV